MLLFVESGASTSSVVQSTNPTLKGMFPALSHHPHLIENANAGGKLGGSVYGYCPVLCIPTLPRGI